jgi:D-alanyl-D-alanine-carboxypeptidase/D-alanyl-D-alanine-endopeptidase
MRICVRRLSVAMAIIGGCSLDAQVAANGKLTSPDAFPESAAIQRMLDEQRSQRHVVGMVLVTTEPHGKVSTYTSGSAGRGGVSLDGGTLFEIASITKTFTAVLLADMVRQQELALEDPVARYFPPEVKVPERNGRQITLLDLATHSSGLPAIPTNMQPKDVTNPYADYT